MKDPNPIRKTGPVKICYDCDHELYPNDKIILDDVLAKQDSKGRWHCSDCQLTDRRKTLLKIYGPNHTNTKYFQEYEDKMISMESGGKNFGIGPYRKNKYTERIILMFYTNLLFLKRPRVS